MKKLLGLFAVLVGIGIAFALFIAIIDMFAPLGIVLVIIGVVLLYKFRDREDVKIKLYWTLGIGIVLCFGFFIDASSEEVSKETTKTTVSEEKEETETTDKQEDSIKEDVIKEGKIKEETPKPVEEKAIEPAQKKAESVKEEKSTSPSPTQPAKTTPIENKPETTVEKTESFSNCTEMRKVYPSGVPSSHPAYASKHDRDKDNYACER